MAPTYHYLKYAKYRTSRLLGHCWGFGASSIVGLRQKVTPGVLSVHRRDSENIGDMMCSPFRYFRTTERLYELDIEPLDTLSPLLVGRDDPLIIGGGGLFAFEAAINGLLSRYRGPKIGWGVGRNNRLQSRQNQIQTDKFTLLGIRDWQAGHEWLPCVSCLSPLFDLYRNAPIHHDFVLYDHQHVRIPIEGHPRLTNACMSFSKVLAFLSSAETVVSNSYHGAYWARLLGRRVVVLPFSDRLLHMRFPATVGTAENYREAAKNDQPNLEALAVCRAQNLRFSHRVSELIGTELQLDPSS